MRQTNSGIGLLIVLSSILSTAAAPATAPPAAAPATAAAAPANAPYKTDVSLTLDPRGGSIKVFEPQQAGGFLVFAWIGSDTKIALLDLHTGVLAEPVVAQVAKTPFDNELLSPDGQLLAGGFTSLVVVDTASGNLVSKIPAKRAIAFLPDGTLLTEQGPGLDKQIGVWDVRTGKQLRAFNTPGSGASYGDAVSPDGKRLTHLARGRVQLLSTADGKPGRVFQVKEGDKASGPDRVAFSSDGKLMSAMYTPTFSGPMLVATWEVASGKLLPHAADPPGFTSGIYNARTFRYLPDSKLLLSDRNVIDVATGKGLELKDPAEKVFTRSVAPLGPAHVLYLWTEHGSTNQVHVKTVPAGP